MNSQTSYQETRKQNDQQKQLRNLPFKTWWLLYIGVGLIALLSIFAGAYIGMSPEADGQILVKDGWDLLGKIVFSLFYMVMFFGTAEAAFLFWLDKLLVHDVDEKQQSIRTQTWTAWPMLGISLLTMIVTSVAASEILAAWRKSFNGTAAYPAWTQGWILQFIPGLIILHIIMATLYRQSTEEARLERWRRAKMRSAKIAALDAGAQAYVTEFNRVAPQTARQAYTQKAQDDAEQLKAELGIYEQEKRTGKDINGDGVVGDPRQNARPAVPRSVPASTLVVSAGGGNHRSEPVPQPVPVPENTGDEILALFGVTAGKARELLAQNHVTNSTEAFALFSRSFGLPDGMTRAQFQEIYNRLLADGHPNA